MEPVRHLSIPILEAPEDRNSVDGQDLEELGRLRRNPQDIELLLLWDEAFPQRAGGRDYFMD